MSPPSRQTPAKRTTQKQRNRFELLRHVSPILALVSGAVFLAGLGFIALYVAATSGPHLRYLGVGWLTAFAAFVTGCLAGLVVGIPRFVSSGALRHDLEAGRLRAGVVKAPTTGAGSNQGTAGKNQSSQDRAAKGQARPAQADPDEVDDVQEGQGEDNQDQAAWPPAGPGQANSFTPSTNLAEISDWLTKLLLGAGLVELTRLGRPVATLVDTVARGLENIAPSATPSGPAVVAAAAIMATYLVLGFLDGYVVTTLWYGKRLQALGYH